MKHDSGRGPDAEHTSIIYDGADALVKPWPFNGLGSGNGQGQYLMTHIAMGASGW